MWTEQLANGHRWHALAGRHADEVGEALADWLVEFQEAGVDELEDDRRRDDLGDAGDAEAVGRRHDVHRVVRRARAEAGGVDDVPVDRHGDRCRPVAAARSADWRSDRRSEPTTSGGRRSPAGNVVVVEVVDVEVVEVVLGLVEVTDVVVVVAEVADVGEVVDGGDGGSGRTAGHGHQRQRRHAEEADGGRSRRRSCPVTAALSRHAPHPLPVTLGQRTVLPL